MGYTPGVKAPITLDEPDVLDDGDVVEGLGIDSWRRVCGVCGVEVSDTDKLTCMVTLSTSSRTIWPKCL